MRKIIALLIFQFIALHALAADFTVTSNADSGPGTLRQALIDAAANGSATQDRIIFNITDQSEAGRTITLTTNLPDVTANLVIDALSQPGTAFGISDAKVRILNTYDVYYGADQVWIFRGINSGDLTVSGLCMANVNQFAYQVPMFNIKGGGNISISHCMIESGKIYIADCQRIIFKNNLLGYKPDGQPVSNVGGPSPVVIENTLNSIIGGSAAEGNIISGSIKISDYRYVGQINYLISYNKIGSDITGTSSSVQLWTQQERIRIDADFYDSAVSNPTYAIGEISNNLIVNFYSEGIYVGGHGSVSIKGNLINTDKTGTINFETFAPDYYFQYGATYVPTAIYILSKAKAVIGGSNPDDANVIANAANGILEQNASEVIITQNSIFCVKNPSYSDSNIHDFFGINDLTKIPSVKITAIKNNGATGTATPNARVELFYDSKDGECVGCSPRNFLAAVTADAQGNWSYDGPTPASLIASAIYNNQTSYFTTPKVDISGLSIIQPHCGAPGSISNIKFYNATKAQWIDGNNNPVGNGLDLTGLPPGKYKLKVGTSTCGTESDWITLTDDQPKIDVSAMVTTQPSCNLNGSISGIKATIGTGEQLKYSWKDESLTEKGTSINITGLVPGKYTLTVTGATNGCASVYGPITLTTGTGPQITQTNAIITGSNCGESAGSIAGITATGAGTLTYTWKNAQGMQVANTANLLNQPAGNYTLQVNDGSGCGPVYSSVITIPQLNGVSIDEGTAVASPAVCGGNGSIDGFVVTGASSSVVYRWYDQQDRLKGTTREPAFSTPSPGTYYMVASDGACSARSTLYTIGQQSNTTDYAAYLTRVINNATCGNNDGNITVTIGAPASADIKAYRWVTKPGAVTLSSTTNKITNLDAGIYQLYITGNNNCEKLAAEFTVDRIAGLNVTTDRVQVRADNCNQGLGSITGLKVNEITGKPATCKWTDATGTVVGTAPDLLNRRAGVYTLNVSDGTICDKTLVYTIQNTSATLAPPVVNDLQLCAAGDVLLSVNGTLPAYSYRLYDSPNSITPVDVQASGKFKISVTGSRLYYVSQFAGDCESPRAEVKVVLGGLSALKLPNAISPNGDGINDTWKISGIESYPAANVQIYTRAGQKVFESVGYATAFNGTLEGKPLAAGTYYYIINLNSGCSLLSGSLTIIR